MTVITVGLRRLLFLKEKKQKNFKTKQFLMGVVMEVAKHELTVSTPEASLV